MKIGTVSTVNIKTSAKTGKQYAEITIKEVPNITGVTFPNIKVGDKVAYNFNLNIVGNIDERN